MTIVTGLAFDLPEGPWMDPVKLLRARHDPARLAFPIEITVVGSSGLGWFSGAQTQSELEQRVARVARDFQPFTFRFGSVERFPESAVYYLAPLNEHPFHEFQRRLARSGLLFEPTPYEYVPHCTIAILPEDAGEETHAAVGACPISSQVMEVTSVSFWSVDPALPAAQRGKSVQLGI